MTDYKHLLIQYMRHVVECESITFLNNGWHGPILSDEELKMLRDVEREIREGE